MTTTKLVYFKTLNGLTLAYRTLLVNDGYLIVVDAASGKVLYRDSFKDSANGLAFDNRPGAAAGGTQHSFDVNGPGGSWNFGAFNPLVGTDAGLSSNNVWVYSDINDSNGASVSELIRNDGTGNFNYAFTPFTEYRELAVLDGLSVLLELALPGRRVLLGYEPEAERHTGVLLRQHLPRPPAGRPDRLHGGRG